MKLRSPSLSVIYYKYIIYVYQICIYSKQRALIPLIHSLSEHNSEGVKAQEFSLGSLIIVTEVQLLEPSTAVARVHREAGDRCMVHNVLTRKPNAHSWQVFFLNAPGEAANF